MNLRHNIMQKWLQKNSDLLFQDSVAGPAADLRNAGALSYAVGIGRAIPEELDEISGDPERSFAVEDFDQLAELVLEPILASICAGKSFLTS